MNRHNKLWKNVRLAYRIFCYFFCLFNNRWSLRGNSTKSNTKSERNQMNSFKFSEWHRKLSNVKSIQVCSSQRALDKSFIKYKVVQVGRKTSKHILHSIAVAGCRWMLVYIIPQAVMWSEKQTNQLIFVCSVDFSKRCSMLFHW